MPILLEEDLRLPLPQMHRVRQTFQRPRLDDVEGRVSEEMSRDEIRRRIKPGAKVAVGVGSRGIKNLNVIVKAVLDGIKKAGGEPFIVAAMGSHGGGTSDGQRDVLSSYGITEDKMGVKIKTSVDVTHIGRTANGIDVYFDKAAFGADMVVPINRVKLHTDFVADIQSGLCKMLVIGFGNHIGCTAVHEENFDAFGGTLLEAAGMILGAVNVAFGIAIVENAFDETAMVEAIPSEKLIEREKQILKIARENMPTLMIPDIDVLIVREIGKNISGAGYDPNILGKSFLLHEFALPVPKIKRMVLLDVTAESH
ncbi:MAG: nickel-dependent lactate racemase, partial [Synergistaceae bacterium]|nr:nickel-dependent lactate racemase [Synergistaceae bacterium]